MLCQIAMAKKFLQRRAMVKHVAKGLGHIIAHSGKAGDSKVP
jgi:hypothetical protein